MMRKHAIVAVVMLAAGFSPPVSAAQTLPADIAASKVVRIATNTGYPPLESRDPATNKLVGFDIDLVAAITKILGVTAEYQESAFDQMTPSLQTGRVDLIISGFYDLPRRQVIFDFLDYLEAGPQLFGLDNNAEIKTLTDVCGQNITTGRGTSYPEAVKTWSDKNCVAVGKKPITVQTETDFGQELSSLKQGRVVAVVNGMQVIPTVMEREPGIYRMIGPPFSSALVGMAFSNQNPTLLHAFQFALNQVVADGQYAALLKKWKLEFSAYPSATINAGNQP